MGLDRVGEIDVAAQSKQLPVKLVVDPENADQIVRVDRMIVPSLNLLQLVEVTLVDGKWNLSGSGGFEKIAQCV